MPQPATTAAPAAPTARGPLSEWAIGRMWRRGPEQLAPPVLSDGFGDDVQLALYLAYEGHFTELGLLDEWDQVLLSFRSGLEDRFVGELRRRIGRGTTPWRVDLRDEIPRLIEADDGPSLSRHMEVDGTLEQFREFVLHRSAYQLKEGDAHTLGIARLQGVPKQILARIQAGEYGADDAGVTDREMHSALFAQTMRALGLDDRPNRALDQLPASALMVSNLISLFGVHRRWRGALVGHLAVFEMTSVTPMGRYGRALQRLGAPLAARRFYDVHVLADAEHERLALDMAVALAADEPHRVDDIVFGARAVLAVEREFAGTLLRGWRASAAAA